MNELVENSFKLLKDVEQELYPIVKSLQDCHAHHIIFQLSVLKT